MQIMSVRLSEHGYYELPSSQRQRGLGTSGGKNIEACRSNGHYLTPVLEYQRYHVVSKELDGAQEFPVYKISSTISFIYIIELSLVQLPASKPFQNLICMIRSLSDLP